MNDVDGRPDAAALQGRRFACDFVVGPASGRQVLLHLHNTIFMIDIEELLVLVASGLVREVGERGG